MTTKLTSKAFAGGRRSTLVRALPLLVLSSIPGTAGAQRLYYGGDLAGGNRARAIGVELKANDGYKTGGCGAIDPATMCDDMKRDLGANPAGKFKCESGVLFVYIASHGDYSGDDGAFINPAGSVKMNDFAKCVAATVPTCCVLVFCIDSCGANNWWDNYLNNAEKNPFKGINYVAATSKKEGQFCEGTPVGTRIGAGLDVGMTAEQYCSFLNAGNDVKAKCSLDANHKGTLIQTPEPESWAALGMGALLLGRRSRRRARAKG